MKILTLCEKGSTMVLKSATVGETQLMIRGKVVILSNGTREVKNRQGLRPKRACAVCGWELSCGSLAIQNCPTRRRYCAIGPNV